MQLRREMLNTLIERAGLTNDIMAKAKINSDFEAITDVLKDIHAGKSVLYGDYMKTHGADSENWGIIQHFLDLKRKYVRAENFVDRKVNGEDIELEEMLDTYSDMAVYSIMGVQIIFKYIKERDEKDERH